MLTEPTVLYLRMSPRQALTLGIMALEDQLDRYPPLNPRGPMPGHQRDLFNARERLRDLLRRFSAEEV